MILNPSQVSFSGVLHRLSTYNVQSAIRAPTSNTTDTVWRVTEGLFQKPMSAYSGIILCTQTTGESCSYDFRADTINGIIVSIIQGFLGLTSPVYSAHAPSFFYLVDWGLNECSGQTSSDTARLACILTWPYPQFGTDPLPIPGPMPGPMLVLSDVWDAGCCCHGKGRQDKT